MASISRREIKKTFVFPVPDLAWQRKSFLADLVMIGIALY
jgi:hypothetical protein